MLVKCPRCGFSQPQDKYCAQCGVDMETFVPPRKSAVVRYLTSPLTYFVAALTIIAVVTFTVFKESRSTIADRVQFLKGGVQIASTKNQNFSSAPAATPEETVEMDEPEVAAPEQVTMAAASINSGENPSLPTAPAATAVENRALAATGPTAHIYYAEVPRLSLERLYQESQATGQFNTFGDYTAGIIPDMQKRITAPGLKIRILEKNEKVVSKTQQWFTGIRDPESDDDLGLSTFIELADVENNVFRGNLEIVRSLREFDSERARGLASIDPAAATAGLQRNSYPAIFELTAGQGFFVAGVLPRKTHIAHEQELVGKAPFAVLRSPAFQNKETEFVIFIEFEKKP